MKTASVLRVIRLLARSSPWTILLRENTELALARAFGNLKLGRERAYGTARVTRCSPRSGPMLRGRPHRGRSATYRPTKDLLRVGHVETRGALRVTMVNAQTCTWMLLLGVAGKKTRSALRVIRQLSPSKPEELPASSRARENCYHASSQCVLYPKYSIGLIGFVSSL